MSRYVDTLPAPTDAREKKVIVLSFPRNGTLGLYHALTILGYNPCHMRTVFAGGAHELKLLQEATGASYGSCKRYSKEDLQKWLFEYDAITDITPFIMEEAVAAWPDAKFILTTRDEDAWYRSMENTIISTSKNTRSPIFRLLKMFNPFLYEMGRMNLTLGRTLWKDGSRTREAAIQTYRSHNDRARNIVPQDRLIEIKLEDGLGWEQICEFLGKDIPNEPYPRVNNATEFKELTNGFIIPNIRDAMVKLVTVVGVPCIAFGMWYYTRHLRQ